MMLANSSQGMSRVMVLEGGQRREAADSVQVGHYFTAPCVHRATASVMWATDHVSAMLVLQLFEQVAAQSDTDATRIRARQKACGLVDVEDVYAFLVS